MKLKKIAKGSSYNWECIGSCGGHAASWAAFDATGNRRVEIIGQKFGFMEDRTYHLYLTGDKKLLQVNLPFARAKRLAERICAAP